ncbi:hypothetical protein [Peptoniphilus asaccharolyticus]
MFISGSVSLNFSAELRKLNWTSFALGVIVVGLEIGYILAYRAGWNVSKAPLVANICLAVALVFIVFLHLEK